MMTNFNLFLLTIIYYYKLQDQIQLNIHFLKYYSINDLFMFFSINFVREIA